MALFGRIFVILFALMLAATAAGIAVAIGLLGLEWGIARGDPFEHIMFWGVAVFASGVAAFIGFLPTLIGIVLAETFSVRSLLVYAVAGAGIMLLGYYGAGFARTYEESIDRAPLPISREAELAAAAGAVFGLTYWAIAGRRSGMWRKRASG